jgi:hypothetical protein
MKTNLIVAAGIVLLLWLATPVGAHRLDEYLQAMTISIDKDRVSALMRLTPGVAVFPAVMAGIDTDKDGVLSPAEQQAYARRVLGDLALTLDGNRLQLRLISATFPSIDEMKGGLGDIVIVFDADVPPGGPARRLVLENHHQRAISAYLMNCLVPRDPDIQVTGQTRNYEQTVYQLDYTQAGVRPTLPLATASWSAMRLRLGANVLAMLGAIALLWRRRRAS